MKIPARLSILLVALCAASVLAVSPAFAAEKKVKTKKHEGAYSNSKGKSGAFEGTTTREQGKATREGSVTNQDGQAATRRSERTWDKATGTGAHTRTTTGPGGKTAERVVASKKNADGTITRTIQVTHPDGSTSTRTETITVETTKP